MTFKAHLLKHEGSRIAVYEVLFLHKSYSLATLEHFEPLSLENRIRIVALMPEVLCSRGSILGLAP
jgi:hypothetical protein